MQPNPPDSIASDPPAASLSRRVLALAARPRAALGWLAASRRRLVLAGAAVLGLLAAAVAIVMFRGRAPAAAPVTLPMALAALDRGNDAEAKRLAEKLRQQGDLSTEEWGGPDFVLGMVAVHQAQLALDKQKTAAYRTAAEYLQDAHDRGFPDGRQAVGLYWLGESLYLCGRISASRPIFQAVLKASPSYRTEVHRRLADAWLNESPPAFEKPATAKGGLQSSRPGPHPGAEAALEKALAENEQVLSAAELSAAERSEALVQRAQILFRLGRLSECCGILDRIPARGGAAGEVAVLRGRMLYGEAEALAAAGQGPENRRKARERYQAAIDALRLAQQRDTIGNRATRQAMVLTALCLLGQGQRQAACTLLDRTSKLFAGTPEGTAAAFHQAQQVRRMGNDQAALAAYRRLLADISGAPEFHNPWISLAQVQAEVAAACQEYLAANRYELALGLSRLLAPPVVSKVRALEVRAEAHQAWGQSLLVTADSQPRDRAETLRRQGRLQLRLAGGVYTELARRELASRLYPEQVWKAAAAYGQGQDYPSAVRLLRLYLQNESRKRHAQGLVELGEALLALGECPQALEALGRCMEQYPRDAVSYRARLLAGRAAAVQGDLAQAEAFLRANLDGQSLTPASKEWRDSLFALGQLLVEQGRWAEAMRRLEEAVARYGDAPQAIEARYLIAGAACRAAEAVREHADHAGVVPGGVGASADAGEGSRARRDAEAKPLWEKAIAAYRGVRDALAGRDPRELSEAEQAMLRNCRFALGEVYAALGRYEEAVAAYTEAANAYPDRPEVLEAYVSLAKVYRGMDRAAQARTSLEQARLALTRIPGKARFDETTNYSRTQWNSVLDWMTSL
jgi:TolA-binding protein